MSLEAYNIIQEKRLKPWKGEEEVRFSWMKAIEIQTGLSLNAERDRKDSSHNHVILEYKAPGLFKGRKDSPDFINATQKRLLPYIQRESEKTGIPESDFIGIAIDGEHICFAQVLNGSIKTQHLIPFSPLAVDLVVNAFLSDTRRAFTSENLLIDFGHGAESSRELMQSLSDGLCHHLSLKGNNKVKMLFEEWKTLYGQVADMSVLQAESINRELSFFWSGSKKIEISAKLFVIHTFNSILIKLIAAEIIAAHGLTSFEYPSQAMAAIDDDSQLISKLENAIEKSGLFEDAGISGFIEEVIFSWYIPLMSDNCCPNLVPSIRKLLAKLSLYRLDYLEKTRDILRDLYQGLVPGKLRQSLGEFYTPDWLVDHTLDKLVEPDFLNKRILDPTCGSGAFLLSVIRRKREQAKIRNLTAQEELEIICNTVWGFDLNPLAVQTSRVNFLIEIADLLKSAPGFEIEIPILLADAIYSPAALPDGNQSIVEYNIGSQVAKLNILLPTELALDRERLDLVFKRMSLDVEKNREFGEAKSWLLDTNVLSKDEVDSWEKPLKHTYDQVLNLHKNQWNGIWFRIVRNFFWSATAGHFDVVVGNPPWVRWSKLPELYRHRVKPTCEHYGIFSKTKRHGGNELDISAMITYTAADKWLKENGILAFVITGTIFKNPSSAGFRTFKIEANKSDSLYLQPLSVDDLKGLKPFPDASNHTTVVTFTKTQKEPKYPVSYNVWSAKKGIKKAISSELSLDQVIRSIEQTRKEAFPVNDNGSPWAVLPKGRFNAIKYLSKTCHWTKGRKGITTDLNGVYFVPIKTFNEKLVQIVSRPEAGKKDIGPVRTQWIEPTLLYPLIKGAGDFEACYLKLNNPHAEREPLYTFVPNTDISKAEYAASELRLHSPSLKKTLAWFQNYTDLLESRSTYRRQMKGAPFHAIYNVGSYTFQPWKVVWPEMSSKFYAAVAGSSEVPLIGERVYVPDHKVYFAAFDDKETAYYVCGLLNSNTVKEWVESHNVSIQVADIFKHLNLPQLDTTNGNHLKLAQLVETAHAEHDKKKRNALLLEVSELSEEILEKWSEIVS